MLNSQTSKGFHKLVEYLQEELDNAVVLEEDTGEEDEA